VKEAADIDTGKLANLPESVTKKVNITETILDAVTWMEGEGMDVFADTRTHFFGIGMRAIDLDKGAWEQLTASKVAAVLDASITKVSTYVPLEPLDGSATYVIQTREGGRGLLQILGSDDDGVKIRYKLVQGPTPAQPSATPARNADFVVFHPAAQSTAALDAARDFVIGHKWQLMGERGGDGGVTIEAADAGGKHFTFKETPQTNGVARFTVSAEPGAAMSASEVGALLWQQLGWGNMTAPKTAPIIGRVIKGVSITFVILFLTLVGTIVAVVAIARKSFAIRVAALIGLAILSVAAIALIALKSGLQSLVHSTSPEQTAMAARSEYPVCEHISSGGHSAMIHDDKVDLHYAIYYDGDFDSSGGCTYNTHSLKWLEDFNVILKNGRTFGYQRESLYTDTYVKVNGRQFDFGQGRVFALHDDGTVEQLALFPSLAVAHDLDTLSKMVASARSMNEEPVTQEKLKQQLAAAESQLQNLLKTHAPTHELVVKTRQSIETLEKKIEAMSAAGNASAGVPISFGPVIKRRLRYFRNGEGHDVVWLVDGSMSSLPTGFFSGSADTNRDWLYRHGPGLFPGCGNAEYGWGWGLGGAGMKFGLVGPDWWTGPMSLNELNDAIAAPQTGIDDSQDRGCDSLFAPVKSCLAHDIGIPG